MIWAGVAGVNRQAEPPKLGVGGVLRTAQKGFCGVGGVTRQFFGPLDGLLRVEVALETVYLYDTKPTGEYISDTRKLITKSEIPTYGVLTLTEKGITFSSSIANKALYYFFKAEAVFANGRRVWLSTLVNQYAVACSWPVTFRVSGRGAYKIDVFGTNLRITSPDTNYTNSVTELSEIYAWVYLYVGAEPGYSASGSVSFSTITLGGASYPVTVVD